MLPLFLVPATLRETMILASVSSLGYVAQGHLITARNEIEYNQQVGALMVVLGYLPAVVMVLRRPNDGQMPPWFIRISQWTLSSFSGGPSRH